MRHIIRTLLVWAALIACAPSWADSGAKCTITTQNLVPAGAATDASSCAIPVTFENTIAVQPTGTYTGALSLQVTNDGTNWVTRSGAVFVDEAGTVTATIPSAGVGIYRANIGGYAQARVSALSAVTGSAVVIVRVSGVAGQSGGPTAVVSGTVSSTQGTNPWVVTGSGGTFPVTGTFWQATQPVSSTTLATAAKQPALGTAGSPSADVITVQGGTNGTPLRTQRALPSSEVQTGAIAATGTTLTLTPGTPNRNLTYLSIIGENVSNTSAFDLTVSVTLNGVAIGTWPARVATSSSGFQQSIASQDFSGMGFNAASGNLVVTLSASCSSGNIRVNAYFSDAQ